MNLKISSYKTYSTKIRVLNIEGGGKHIILQAKINDYKSNLIIDTGASSTIFDKDNKIFADINFVEMLLNSKSSGFNSEIDSLFMGKIEKFKISHYNYFDFKTIFTSMKHINSLYNNLGLPCIAGILGSDFLVKNKAIIDFDKKIISFTVKTK